MKPMPRDIAALLITSPQPAPSAIRARVSALVNADQDTLDTLRRWAAENSATSTPKEGDAP